MVVQPAAAALAGVMALQASQVLRPLLALPTDDLWVIELQEDVVEIGREGPAKEPLHVLDHKGTGHGFTDGPNSLREHIPLVCMPSVCAAKRERLAGRATGNQGHLLSEFFVVELAHVTFNYPPTLNHPHAPGLILPDRFAGVMVPLRHELVLEARQGGANGQPPGAGKQFNGLHVPHAAALSVVGESMPPTNKK